MTINETQYIKNLLRKALNALNEKNFPKGKKLLNKIFSINPNIFEVNYNLAVLNAMDNNFTDSIKFYKNAINLKKDSAEVYFNLAMVYQKNSQLDLAIENFKKAIELGNNNEITNYNIGALYKAKFDNINAEKYFQKSISINVKFELGLSALFDLYDKSNDLKKFDNLLEKIIEDGLDNNFISYFSGINEFKKKNYNQAIKNLVNLNLGQKNIDKNIVKCGILAKSYDHVGKYEEAYNSFVDANNLMNEGYGKNIDKNIFLNYVKQRINFFKNNKQLDWKGPIKVREDYKEPVFLIGFPRSGTTLLDTILRTKHSIEVIEEKPIVRNFLIKLEKTTKNDFKELKNLDNDFIEEMRKFYFQERNKYLEKNDAKIVVDKMPLNIIHVGEILRFFPKAKFILALRHPYDSVFSCFMQQFSLNPAMKNFLTLESSAFLYDLVMQLWKVYHENFKINLHIIKYENIIENFDQTVKDVLNFLSVDWSSDYKDFYKIAQKRTNIMTPSYSQVTSPIYKSSLNRWKNYENKFEKSKTYLDKWIKEFNYN